MKLFVLVAMAFLGDVPMPPHAFLYTDMAMCEAARAKVAVEVKKEVPEARVWSECREVVLEPRKQNGLPTPAPGELRNS